MNTQTHMLMGALLYGRWQPRLLWAGLVGGLVPDLPMFIIYAALKTQGVSNREIFGDLFFSHWWQIANSIGHNFFLWSLVLAASMIARPRWPKQMWPGVVGALSAAALTHSVVDFLCHREDAHMHLWPLTQWKFVSPVSYYDPAHYGVYFSLGEAVLGIVMAGLIYANIRNIGARFALGLAIFTYAAVLATFLVLRL